MAQVSADQVENTRPIEFEDEASLYSEALAKLFTRIGEVSSLPLVAQKITQIVNDDSSCGNDLLTAIESDPAMAIRTMRRVNSTFFGLRNKVEDLSMAINLLGFREIRNLALTLYIAKMFEDPGEHGQYRRESLWEHLVSVAATARMIAQECKCCKPDEAYLAGLLHDVGWVLIDQYLRRQFVNVLDHIQLGLTSPAAELKELPFDHCQLGAFVCHKWDFAPAIVAGIRYHHQPENYHGKYSNLVSIVALANFLCSRNGITSLGSNTITTIDNQVIQNLNLTEDSLASIYKKYETTIQSIGDLVNFHHR